MKKLIEEFRVALLFNGKPKDDSVKELQRFIDRQDNLISQFFSKVDEIEAKENVCNTRKCCSCKRIMFSNHAELLDKCNYCLDKEISINLSISKNFLQDSEEVEKEITKRYIQEVKHEEEIQSFNKMVDEIIVFFEKFKAKHK
jgi:hypothetical protein